MVECEIIIEPEVKFLIFNTYNSLQYWDDYIKHFLKENKIYGNIFDKDRLEELSAAVEPTVTVASAVVTEED